MKRMPWSRLRKAVKDRFAVALQDRLDLHQARYRNTSEEAGRVWITLDGSGLVSFDTARYVARRAAIAYDMRAGVGPFALSAASNHAEYLAADEAAKAMLRAVGEYDDYSALEDLEAYLSMSLEEALGAPVPLLRALAVADRRLGKRRLRTFELREGEHPIVRTLFAARLAAEGIER